MKSKEQVIVVDAESSVSEGSEQGTSSFKVAFNIMKTIIGKAQQSKKK